jgi:hypothetical protein
MKSRNLTTLLILLMSAAPLLFAASQQEQTRQHRRQRSHHRFVDQDGDGIEDNFQHRYGRRRLCHLVDEHLPLMRELLSLGAEAPLRMVCRLEEIPPDVHEAIRELYAQAVPAPPSQIQAEDEKLLTVFYSWSDDTECLYRWYLLIHDDEIVRLDGRRLLPPPAGEGAEKSPFPPAVTWNAADSALEQ